MRKLLRISLTAIVLTFVLSAFSGCEEKDVLKRMEKHSKSLKSFRADIIMEKFNSQLEETDVSKGKLIYVPRNGNNFFLRVDFTSPLQESLEVVNSEFLIYMPKLKQAFTGKIDESKVAGNVSDALAFMNVSRKYLKANYNLKYIGEEKISSGILTHHLEFTPKAVKDYKKVEFWIDKDGMPNLIKVTIKVDDMITIRLTNIEKNVTIDSKDFTIQLPKNTKIVK